MLSIPGLHPTGISQTLNPGPTNSEWHIPCPAPGLWHPRSPRGEATWGHLSKTDAACHQFPCGRSQSCLHTTWERLLCKGRFTLVASAGAGLHPESTARSLQMGRGCSGVKHRAHLCCSACPSWNALAQKHLHQELDDVIQPHQRQMLVHPPAHLDQSDFTLTWGVSRHCFCILLKASVFC